jgi:hypothetical protein
MILWEKKFKGPLHKYGAYRELNDLSYSIKEEIYKIILSFLIFSIMIYGKIEKGLEVVND